MNKYLIVLSLIISFLVSCEKYEKGGLKSKVEKNLIHQWELDSYFLNGTDQTSNLLVTDYTDLIEEDGSFINSYTDNAGDPIIQDKRWVLTGDQDEISFYDSLHLELTAESPQIVTRELKIVKLKKNELWYSVSYGANTHEFHMIKD